MALRLLVALARVRVTVAYAVIVTCVTTAFALGHIGATLLGSLTAAIPRRWRPGWTPPAWALCGVGALFGFLMLASTGPSLAIAAGAGLLSAVVIGAVSSLSTGRYALEPQMSHRL